MARFKHTADDMRDCLDITKVLKKKFPDADKVKYQKDGGYWDIVRYIGDDVVVDAYRYENGKLIHFSTIEYEY